MKRPVCIDSISEQIFKVVTLDAFVGFLCGCLIYVVGQFFGLW